MERTISLWGLLVAAALGFLPSPVAAQGVAAPGEAFPHGVHCDKQPCTEVLPGAVSFESVEGMPYVRGLNADGELLGWLVLSNDVVHIKGYSGKPIATLIGLDPEGRITGGRVIKHSEPILLVGIPEQKLTDFVNSYRGLPADARVVVGGDKAPGVHTVDVISGATVTVLSENRTILETAQGLGQEVGVLKVQPLVPGHFINTEEVWTWPQLLKKGALGHLLVTQEDIGLPPGPQPFIELWFGIADTPQVGTPLLGEHVWKYAMDQLTEGEHLVVILGNGTSTFKGSGFVRGGTFDRVHLEQGIHSTVFKDLDYTNIQPPPAEGAPYFKEGALFVAREGLDPGAPYELVFLGSAFDLKGGFSRRFHTARATHRLPKTIYKLDGPDPETVAILQAWASHPVRLGLYILYLLAVIGVFAGRRWSTASMKRLNRLHPAFLVITFVVLGLILRIQPSVTQVLTLLGGVVGEWRWGLFLSDPFLFVSWIFIAGVTIAWGRGVFCGWTCPYGAFNELTFKLGRLLKLPTYELPDAVHFKARYIRYAVFGVLVLAYLIQPETGEKMAEVEPFKSTFFVPPWSRNVLLFAWWLVLFGASVFTYRPFCRYLCPLGAALAVPSSLRISGPYRRDFCSKGCKICPRGCEPRAIRKDGSIDPRECLNCWECEANYRDDEVCPPLVQIRRQAEKEAKKKATPRRASAGIALALGLAAAAPSTAQAGRTLVVGRDGATVQETLDRSQDGDLVLLPEGTWAGPARVEHAITLRSDGGVLDGGMVGTVLRVAAPGARISQLTVRGSGDDRGGPDACVFIEPTALSAVVERSDLSECLFGIWVHEAQGVRIEDNVISGRTDITQPSSRGNGIHLFNSKELVVRGNRVTGSRDGIYVSATHKSLIEGNTLSGLRFGIHYMYSFDNTVRGNRTCDNVAGIELMQSSRLKILDNVSCNNERHGILFRDVQYSEVSGNTVEGNGEGMFFFSSLDNRIEHNRVAHNVIGARVWAGTERNVVKDNAFIGNRQQIFYVARDDQRWGDEDGGNYWSDYLGWDQDGDGLGDRPYRVDSLLSRLTYEHPAAVLLLHSPTLELLTRLQQQLPALRVPTIIDPHPLLEPPGGRG